MGEENNVQAEAKPAGEKIGIGKRIVGTFIDSIIAGVASGVISTVLGIVLGMVSGFLLPLAGALGSAVAAVYMLLRDSILGNGQSIGKKIMKYQVVGPDGKPCTQDLSIKRNLPLALGSIVGAIAGLVALVPVVGPIVGGLAAMLMGLISLAIIVAELYFINSDAAGNRWGDKYAGTTTVPVE